MIVALVTLLVALVALSVPWLLWAQPTGRELRVGLISIATTAALLLVTMIVLTPHVHW
jgi:hypothetical protein